jgi:hypothetical protein
MTEIMAESANAATIQVATFAQLFSHQPLSHQPCQCSQSHQP